MATVEDLVEQSLARAMEFSDKFPATRSLLYRRLGVRQQQLFALAARTNPEFFGSCAIGTLDANKAINIGLTGDPNAGDPVEAMEFVSKIQVENPGTSSFAVGADVNLLLLTDPDAAYPPRVTLRGNVIRQVGTDLAGVTSIRVYYSVRPFRINPEDSATVVRLPEPFHDLLVVDLAKWMLRKTATLSKEVRTVAMEALNGEEAETLENFLEEVTNYTRGAERGRFGRTAGVTHQ